MSVSPESLLPAHILERATAFESEWAWPIEDIPAVIEAARIVGLVNVGGQLQFRLPGPAICELYWVEVDTLRVIPPRLAISWQERVERTASLALAQYRDLESRYDFLAEAQSVFGRYLDAFRAGGGDPRDTMCFIWYVEAEPEREAPD